MRRNYEDIGLHVPEIMMPSEGTDLTAWAVIACDQYTSQPEYWKEVEKIASGKPSALYLTLPEIYLNDNDTESRIMGINKTMEDYIKDGTITKQEPGFILTDRATALNPSRKGLIIAVDLEKYDYSDNSQSLIRATEGTVLERIPPRVKIRENAALELPHIMLLIDDPEKTVIEPLFKMLDKFEKLYDFELMQNGGHIKGWKISDEKVIEGIADALRKLAQPEYFREKYDVGPEKGVLLFAVGDGNHSLASAKAHWENVKKNEGLGDNSDHPARYALAEVVNLHDEGIVFEPIHRVLFNVDTNKITEDLFELGADVLMFDNREEMESAIGMVEAIFNDEGYSACNNCQYHFDEFGSFGTECSQGAVCSLGTECGSECFECSGCPESPGSSKDSENSKSSESSDSSELSVCPESCGDCSSCSAQGPCSGDNDLGNENIARTYNHIIPFISEGKYGLAVFRNSPAILAVGSLQAAIESLEKKYPDMKVDYIHGENVVTELGSKPGNMGFYLPPMDKNDLFKTVIMEGALPKKTFSMGEAEEKRYYLECRKITR